MYGVHYLSSFCTIFILIHKDLYFFSIILTEDTQIATFSDYIN